MSTTSVAVRPARRVNRESFCDRDNLRSVNGAVYCTTLKPATSSADVLQTIADALQFRAALEAKDIVLEFEDSVVALRAYMQSHQERNDAAFAAGSIRKVSKVENLPAVQR